MEGECLRGLIEFGYTMSVATDWTSVSNYIFLTTSVSYRTVWVLLSNESLLNSNYGAIIVIDLGLHRFTLTSICK